VTVTTPSGTSATSSADQFAYLVASQTITFAPTSPVTYGVSPITLSATATSGLPVTFTLVSGPATLSGGNVLTVTGTGTILIDANQAGNAYYSAAPQVQASIIVNAAPAFTVTVLTDDAGVAANCTNQTLPGAVPDASCSLRDAIAAAALVSTSTVTPTVNFAPALTSGGAATYTLSASGLTLTKNMNITGPGANLMSVSGNGGNFTVLTDTAGITSTISGLTITGGISSRGGGLYTYGNMSLNQCAIANNTASDGGGGIYNEGTLTMTGDTVADNTASNGTGGGIFNFGSLILSDSTVTGNTSGTDGGGILQDSTMVLNNTTVTGNAATLGGGGIYFNYGTATLANSIIIGNSGGSWADIYPGATYTANGGNALNTKPSGAAVLANLAPLGDYGGTTQTMPPLPGSAAICAGTAANATAAGLTTDQRGNPRSTTAYNSTPCVDAGAVQSAYSLSFVTQPSTTQGGASITPAPTVQLFDNGSAFSMPGAPIGMSAAAGTLSGTTSQTTSTSGLATWSNLSILTGETGDTLTASAAAGPYTVSATSGTFNILPVAALGFGTPPASPISAGGNAGSAITVDLLDSSSQVVTTAPATALTLTVTGPGNYSQSYPATTSAGVATFNLSGAALTKAGTYTYTTTDSTHTATLTEVANAGAAATVTATGNATSGQSVAIGVAYPWPFSVLVTDANNNPVPSVTVTYAVPGNGASAVLSSTTAQTDASGVASVTGTANGTADSFSVQASVSGVTPSVFFTVNNQKASSVTTVSGLPQDPVVYGSSKTTLTSTTNLSAPNPALSTPTGSVTFQDNLGNIGQPSAVAGGHAVYSDYFMAGNHYFVAQYTGDSNYTPSTSSTLNYQVTQAPVTLTALPGQSIPVFSAGSTLSATVTGAHSGAGILVPGSGGTATVSYAFFNGSTQVGASYSTTAVPGASNSTVVLTIPSAVANTAGPYSVHVAFNGDSNYQASGASLAGGSGNSLSVSFTVQQATPELALNCAEVTYDGNPHSCVGSATGNGGARVAGTWSYSPTSATGAGSTTVTGTFTSTDSNYTSGGTAGNTLTIDKAAQSISFASTSASTNSVTYGVPPITLSVTGGTSGKPVTLSILSGPGSLNGNLLTIIGAGTVTVAADQAGNSNYDAATEVTHSIVVNQAASGVSLSSNPNPVLVQNTITLTATVTSSAGTPTGVVTFLDGITPLGAGTLSASGVAMFPTASLAIGSHSITASYGGDTNFASSGSLPLPQVVQDFNLTITGGTTGVTSVTVLPGGKAVFTFTVSPDNSSAFPSAVTLSASGLPAGATYSFSPAALAAGTGTTTVTLTIQIPQAGANNLAKLLPSNAPRAPGSAIPDKLASRLAPLSLALLLLPFARRMRRAGKNMGRMMSVLLLLVVGLAAVAGMSGCGSTNGFFSQQQKTYTVKVTGTSGALSHFTTVTLTVE
jgi:hypothetical protein